MDERWETRLRPNFPTIVSQLRARTLLNELFAAGLIERRDIIRLRSAVTFPTDEDVATELLLQVLPKAGPGSFDKFCSVLLKSKGQEAIAELLMREEEKGVAVKSTAAPGATRRPVDDTLLDVRVEDKHIDAIKKVVGKQWRQIAKNLPEYTIADAEDVVSRYVYESPSDGDKFYYVITAWVWKIGRRATVRKLLEAIDKVDLGEEARKLLGFW